MDYRKAYGRMHESYKRFPGYSLGAYVDAIKVLVEQHRPDRLLDYGSGKGFQYLVRRYHDRWGGLLPHCYDIGIPQLAVKPEGVFGGVLCTDVLEHIEEKDIPAILSELIGYTSAGGFLLLGISCRPSRKTLPDGRDVHVTVKPSAWWIDQIKKAAGERRPHIVAHFDIGGHFDEPDSIWELP